MGKDSEKEYLSIYLSIYIYMCVCVCVSICAYIETKVAFYQVLMGKELGKMNLHQTLVCRQL